MKNVERPLKWSGFLITAGLIVQLACLLRVHALAFIAFLTIGCPLVAIGIGLYLFSILSHSEP